MKRREFMALPRRRGGLHGRSLCARLPTMMFTCGSPRSRCPSLRDRACIHTPIENDAAPRTRHRCLRSRRAERRPSLWWETARPERCAVL